MDFDIPDMSDLDIENYDFDAPDPTMASEGLTTSLAFERKVNRRATLASLKKDNLAKLVPVLPSPDSDLHILGNGEGAETARGIIDSGKFDFGSFIPHLVGLMGNKDITCYCSTWVMNMAHVEMLLGMLQRGELATLSILTDPFFKRRHTSSIAAQLVSGLSAFGERGRILFFKNHAKILCLSNADQTAFVSVAGSSNLTSVQRVENYVLSTAEDVYRFYTVQFFEAMFSKAQTKS